MARTACLLLAIGSLTGCVVPSRPVRKPETPIPATPPSISSQRERPDSFVLEYDGKRYRIRPNSAKLGRIMGGTPDLQVFEAQVRSAAIRMRDAKKNVAVGDLIFSHMSARAAPGEPDMGPPVYSRLVDYASIEPAGRSE